uniref:Uncharacterized protein n=2 Tax=Aegilops tauschii subsp. strangulata TaxID=200361 RepID=A0A453JVQ7_AEGTS
PSAHCLPLSVPDPDRPLPHRSRRALLPSRWHRRRPPSFLSPAASSFLSVTGLSLTARAAPSFPRVGTGRAVLPSDPVAASAMAAAGGPLQGQARPGQACWPPSRVTASAVTTATSSSLEAAAPLKADLRHVSDPSISSLQQCSGCTHEFDLEKPPVLQEVADFFSGHGIEDFTFSRGRLVGQEEQRQATG